MKFLWGGLAILAGIVLVIKTEWFIQNFGSSAWAEAKLGTSGGTRLMYKLIGIALIFGAFLGTTGLLGKIILSFFGPLFGGAS